jgi:protein-S-isoprenylcysteine O-methyltransferase Ste14
MSTETIFRTLFILAFIAMMCIRFYYQAKILSEQGKFKIQEGKLSLIAGSIAALTTLVFGSEYIFFPGFFSFAYALHYPDGLRWFGGLALAGGIALLAAAHHYLGLSFNSLVGSKEGQVLVETGPYRWIRHPIYLAYLLNYVGGGLLAGNWVLTGVPVTMFAIVVIVRIGQEERVMTNLFGQQYIAYMKRTGRLLPRIKQKAKVP